MKKIITILLVLGLNYSCSTNNDGDENSTTSVVPVAPSNLTGTVVSATQINLSAVLQEFQEGGATSLVHLPVLAMTVAGEVLRIII